MEYTVTWEFWIYDESAKPVAIHFGPDFSMRAITLNLAIGKAQRRALRRFNRMRKEHPAEYPDSFHYMVRVLGLMDKSFHYHKLLAAHEVFYGTVRKRDDYGSSQ